MNIPAKSNSLQTYQVVLYDRALHPELFKFKGRRVVRHGDYEFEGWILPAGHVLRFEKGPLCASELVTDQEDNLPSKGVVSAGLCAGERDFEHDFQKAGVRYMNTVQTETLSENLYAATFDELFRHGQEAGALMHRWEDEIGPCMSMLDIQRMSSEVHAQGYHLLAAGGLVLRTQTIFEHS